MKKGQRQPESVLESDATLLVGRTAFLRRFPIFLGGVLISSIISCQAPPKKKDDRIQALLELKPDQVSFQANFTQEKLLPESQFGYVVLDPESNQILEQHQADQLFIPASTTKIPSSVAALELLGPEFRFKTSLLYRGSRTKGILEGDLYLKGTGDPALKVAHLMNIADKLQQAGIREVRGHFYFDETAFVPQESIEVYREPWAAFNSGVSALSVDFNQFRVHWSSISRESSVSTVYSIPSFPFVRFSLWEHPFTAETSWVHRRDQEFDQWLLSPHQVNGGEARLPLKRPALATASLFVELCRLRGIQVPAPQSGKAPQGAKVIFHHESPPLIELVESILEYSNNLMAELVQLAAARSRVQKSLKISDAAAFIEDWIKKTILKDSSSNLKLVNGSGLTSENRITPLQLARILQYASGQNLKLRSFETLLAISGKKGDLEGRLAEPGLALHVLAKTGAMDFSRAISGYLYSSRGKKLVFAILATHWEQRNKIDQSQNPTSRETLDRAKKWAHRARKTQDEFLKLWIAKY